MKTGKTLSQLAVELERRAKAKIDIVADTRKVTMLSTADIRIADDLNEKIVTANEIAHSQISTRLDIPGKYYNRLLEEFPALLAENVNTWLAYKGEKRLLRIMDGKLRAFLSDRYQRIENEQIASAVLPVLLEVGSDIRIESAEITDSRMYIKAVFPKIQMEVTPGDVVQSGIVISNSEVGHGSVKIEPLIYRLVCLNGLIINDAAFMARHIGGRISKQESIFEILSDETLRADDNAMMLKIRDVTRASLSDINFAKIVDKMREAKNDKLKGNIPDSVKVLTKKYSLNEFEGDSILRHLIDGADLSRYGLLNAVTRTSQDVESYDRATELETLGGVILQMKPNQWKEYALAA